MYDTTIDRSVSNNSHTQLLDLVGEAKVVLDVGCATGYLAEALVRQGCVVTGIEYDAEAADLARPHLEQVVVGDLNTLQPFDELPQDHFDVLVFGDVLEHLTDPAAVLSGALPLLKADGSVVISVPNVTHGSVRLALLQGRWQYTATGLLDRTHITFFTRRSLLELLSSCGLVAVDSRQTTADPLGVEVAVDPSGLPAGVTEWVRGQPDALTYQFVLRAVRGDGTGAEVVAVAERDQLRAQLADAERRAAELDGLLEEERAATERLMSTRTMRVLAGPRALYARLRGALGRAR